MTQWVMCLLYLLNLNTQNPHKADIIIHVCNSNVPTVVWKVNPQKLGNQLVSMQ